MEFESEFREVRSIGNENWLHVFYHNCTNYNYFENETEAEYLLNSNKYSILSKITNNLRMRGQFEFVIYWPSLNTYYRWRQKYNPIKELEKTNVLQAAGFELLYPKVDNANHKFGGLVRTSIPMQNLNSSLLNGNPGLSVWFFAIGMYQKSQESWYNSGIPAINGSVSVVSLWLLLPHQITCMIQMPLIHPSHFLSLFLIL